MRLGFFLPQIGPAASPESLIVVAKRAEEMGYDSLWVTERLLYPISPQTPYVGTADGSLPEPYKRVFDPLGALTYVAAHTSRIALGTSVLDIPYYNPVMLARQLTTLDIVSGGRLRVGLGLGWSKDEYDAVNAPMRGRGLRATEFIQVLKAIWTTDPVEFRGEFYNLPKSIIQPKPMQQPHPPIYLAAYASGALRRVATLANGWMPIGVPVDGMAQMMRSIREMAQQAGREPGDIEFIVRANLMVTDRPLGARRWIFTGSEDEIRSDIIASLDIGADEIIFDPTFSPEGATVDGFLARMQQIRDMVKRIPAAALP